MLFYKPNVLRCFLFLYLIKLSKSSLLEDKLSFIFDVYMDINKDQKLNKADIIGLCNGFAKAMGWPLDGERYNNAKKDGQEMIDIFLEETGTTNKGYINKSEFLNIMIKKWESKPKFDDLYQRFVFNGLDLNDDGVVSKEENVRFFTGLGLDKNEVETAYSKMTGGKNTFNREDFSRYWTEYHTSNLRSTPGNNLAGTTRFST